MANVLYVSRRDWSSEDYVIEIEHSESGAVPVRQRAVDMGIDWHPRHTNIRAALSMERVKYEESLKRRGLMGRFNLMGDWGSRVSAYNLLEIAMKAVYFARGVEAWGHKMRILFDGLEEEEKNVLRLYYDDFCHETEYLRAFPFATLEEFLDYLDGPSNLKSHEKGSVGFRFMLLSDSYDLPQPPVELMLDLVGACLMLMEHIGKGHDVGLSRRWTLSWRKHHWGKKEHYYDWKDVMLNLSGDRETKYVIEKLWGSDYKGRFSYFIFDAKGRRLMFGALPEDLKGLDVMDKREELANWDRAAGLMSIGITPRPDQV